MKLKFKLLALIISLSLTACGGGSSSKGSSDNSNSTENSEENNDESGSTENTDTSSNDGNDGNGTTSINSTSNCVTIARPQVGQIEVLKTTSPSGGDDLYLKRKVLKLTNTFYSEEFSVRSGSENGEVVTASTVSQIYTIANNFKDIVEITGSSLASMPDATGAISTQEINTVGHYSPYLRTLADRACEGQTWTTNYDVIDVTTFGIGISPITSTTHHSQIHTIVAININKTVLAGNFNTVQYKFEDGNTIVTTWIDIATGLKIVSEAKETTGSIITHSELVSFTR